MHKFKLKAGHPGGVVIDSPCVASRQCGLHTTVTCSFSTHTYVTLPANNATLHHAVPHVVVLHGLGSGQRDSGQCRVRQRAFTRRG